MQIQVNALMLLLERHTPDVAIKDEFQQLISEEFRRVEHGPMLRGLLHKRQHSRNIGAAFMCGRI